MERLSDDVRCVAPDMMGFGASGQPRIPYSFYNHAEFLDEFVEALELTNITLFIQDWGGAIGFDHAVRHQNNIRAIAFLEAILKPYPTWRSFPQNLDEEKVTNNDPQHAKSNLARMKFMEFRGLEYDGADFSKLDNPQGKKVPPRDVGAIEVGGFGWREVTEKNVFLKIFMGPLLGHPFDPTSSEYADPFNHPVLGPKLRPYVEPFPTAWSRYPIWGLSKEIPIADSPPDMAATVGHYSQVLTKWDVPKLLIYSDKGPTLKEEHAQWVRQNWTKNLTVENLDQSGIDVVEGTHFIQAVHADEVTSCFRNWFAHL